MVVLGLMGRDLEKLKILDLFSGIGGFSLGLERTGGFETAAFCEIDRHAQAVLNKHWPETKCYDDVEKLGSDQLVRDRIRQIDLITGGFPCQDVSVAGKLAGIEEGARSGLWSEIARLVGELRPRYVIVENVSNLLAGPSERPGGWFGRILADLDALGYDAEWHCIPASYLGAWHRRDRVWVVAYPHEISRQQGFPKGPILRQRDVHEQSEGGFARWPGRSNLPESRICGRNDGIPQVVHRLERLGNSVVPQIPEMIGQAILEAERSLGRR